MQIQVRDLGYKIKDHQIFKGVNFSVGSPAMVSIIGPSGSGKTTLLNCISLMLDACEGDISIDGKSVMGLSHRAKLAYWHDCFSFIYQDYGVILEETVLYNICFKKRLKKADKDRAQDILDKVGLGFKTYDKAGVLSGGEKQRLGVARALYKKSQIIFADEPTASLDIDNANMVGALLKDYVAAGGLVICATHDDKVAEISDMVIRL